ncbi:efflux RND transporter periplasmic adaptor subunit [Methylocapsa sp. S129]|uniref:efflux RND transporter periplasmic adaptor subunit n=1 Tax=Methylocapsa sp. S129 TaxID=1641869 RepID=UPI00131C2923|nr:efflux RND transporter periplasmic adaptor subunit [Methylocapsa sp. S129]
MPDATPPRRSRRKLGLFGILAAIGVAALVVTGIGTRDKGNAELRQWTETQALPTVAIASLNAKPVVASLNLPGRLEAYVRAPIYARVSGYVKSWTVDIGGVVKAGQTLAEVEAPDLDQQLLQARADLANSQASAKLADVTLSRGRALLTSNAVSQQDVDQRAADLASKQAAVHSNEANVERLQVLAGYKNISAPFDGLVTERNTDVGALISAGSSAGLAMFVISDVRRLRVAINVPQNYAPAIKIGAKASISVPEYPDRTFPAVVEASSRSVDVGSGTTHMQLIVDNSGGELMPGAYANVHADLSGATGSVRIPVSALIFDQSGLRVATVNADNRVLFKTVTIARDLGSEIEVGSGLGADDRVIAAPPDGIADGDQVRIADDHSKQDAPVAASAKPESGG